MIKIKDYIFNENEINHIHEYNEDTYVYIDKENKYIIENASFDDIEWNYENNISESLSYDLAKARIEELEEENKKLKEDVSFKDKEIDRLEGENKKLKECYCNRTDCSGRIKDSKKYESLQQRIDKAIKYLKLKVDIPKNHLEEAIKDREEDLLKILKGEK